MTEIEIFDEWLNFIKKRGGKIIIRESPIDIHSDKEKNKMYENVKNRILHEYKLLEFVKDSKNIVQFTKKGWEASRTGMAVYIRKKEIKEQKDIFDFKVSKWKYYTFWWFFTLAILGGGYSIYDFVERLIMKKSNNQEEISTITSKEFQPGKRESQNTLALDQKNIDSLSNSKTLSDSLNIQ